MQRAKELAESTFLNAKQIMNLLGINDQSHFARDFKKTYGLTMTEYREHFSVEDIGVPDEAELLRLETVKMARKQ